MPNTKQLTEQGQPIYPITDKSCVIGFPSASRPTTELALFANLGLHYLDTDLGRPIWHNGTNWIDATGATV